MKKLYLVLKMVMLSLNIGLIGWVLYVFKDILLYGHHIAIEPNRPLLVGEISIYTVALLLAVVILVVEVRRELKAK